MLGMVEQVGKVYISNADLGTPDWRMIEDKVPIRTSRCIGTGTVTVDMPSLFCMAA